MINGRKYSLSFDHKPGKKEIEEALRGIDTSISIKGTFNSYASQYISIKEHVLSYHNKIISWTAAQYIR